MYVIFTIEPPCVTTSCKQQWMTSDCLNTEALNDRFILNTLQTLFTPSRSLETYSKRRYKIFICLVIRGESESFRNYKGFVIIFP